MAKRRGNPLALAVMACLAERPMHPYEMAATMRTRGQDASIRLNYGSLYGVVETLLKRGLIEEHEVVREGRRPERTVYRITADGRTEVDEWLAQLLGTSAKEFPQFEAGLSLMGVLPPERVVDLLDQRVVKLHERLSELDAIVAATTGNGVPRLFLTEMDYERALVDADCAFTEQLARDIESERLDGVAFWKGFHAERTPEAERTPDDDTSEEQETSAP
jgi:DNA-binding PadR family transcriptional regulator